VLQVVVKIENPWIDVVLVVVVRVAVTQTRLKLMVYEPDEQ
jgi:hypothetical protein